MSTPFDDIFRVDQERVRKAAREELKRLVEETIKVEETKDQFDIAEEVPAGIRPFPLLHKTKNFDPGEGETILINVRVPSGKIGVLEAIGTNYLLNSPNSYYKVIVDKIPVEGISEADGRITRQIGNLNVPRYLQPPVIFYKNAKFIAANPDNTAEGQDHTMGFTLEGKLMDKPKSVIDGAIVNQRNVQKILEQNNQAQ